MAATDPHRAIEAIWRIESARVIAGLTRILRDVGLAEEVAHDALVAALEQWPTEGVPSNPGAWLMATGRRRAIDRLRRREVRDRKQGEIASDDREDPIDAIDEAIDDDVGDDLLRLVFTCCHPVLSADARVALTLRLIGGLTPDEIARAFLVPEPTIAQRIVRAKKTIAEQGIPFEVPRGPELADRLASVLEVVYLVFNEGYAATSGDTWLRPELCEDALRLGRILAELVPSEAEVHGLVALMEIQASRSKARVAADGRPILLLDQDRSRWDRLLIRRGLAALARAEATGNAGGVYYMQAALAACHARAVTAEDTDWARIVALYDVLMLRWPSPVVALNRAVAVGMAQGPAAALALVDTLKDEPALARYHLLPSVRADLLIKLERFADAEVELRRAIELCRNDPERALLEARAAQCRNRR